MWIHNVTRLKNHTSCPPGSLGKFKGVQNTHTTIPRASAPNPQPWRKHTGYTDPSSFYIPIQQWALKGECPGVGQVFRVSRVAENMDYSSSRTRRLPMMSGSQMSCSFNIMSCSPTRQLLLLLRLLMLVLGVTLVTGAGKSWLLPTLTHLPALWDRGKLLAWG